MVLELHAKGLIILGPLFRVKPPISYKDGIPVVANLKNILVKKIT